jgi:epoxyqueuosine reductase
MSSISHFAQSLKQQALAEGFDLCGIAPADIAAELEKFPEWIEQGRAGEMEYLKARNDAGELKRASLAGAIPWAKSVIVCAMNFNSAAPYSTECPDKTRGWISRYAWFAKKDGTHTDYHDSILARLRRLEDWMHGEWREQQRPEFQSRSYVDTGPIVERVFAKYAGIGWQAKNTCIIHPEIGSWLFLGVIVTSLDFTDVEGAYPMPIADRCGSCTRCIEACPTGAITAPYQLDARLCISYLTIEKRGEIEPERREKMGRHVFGCDICQDVCPWNGSVTPEKRPPASAAPEFQPREELVNPPLEWLAKMSRDEFNQTFRGTPIKRAKYIGLRRNVAIAMGNSGEASFLANLQDMEQDDDPAVREAALWAATRLKNQSS